MNSIQNQPEVNVGVDVGKSQLDIHLRPLDISFSVTNDKKGIREALSIIEKHSPARVIVEATGRLEQAFILACAKKNSLALLPIHCMSIDSQALLDNGQRRILSRHK